MFQRDKELLLCFDDDDLKGMSKEKMLGQDPANRFENQKFSLNELDRILYEEYQITLFNQECIGRWDLSLLIEFDYFSQVALHIKVLS